MAVAGSRVEFSVWELMFAGVNLAELGNVTANRSIDSTLRRPIGIRDRLNFLRSDLVSLELAQSEAILLDELDQILQAIDDPERSSRRLGKDAARIRGLVRRVEATLQLEATGRRTFVVQRSREGEIESLLQDPAAYFGISAEGPLTLTPQGNNDFHEAAQCYAVGFSVAAIMFMVRATEDVLRDYYRHVTQQSPSGAWGNLTTVLKIPVLNCPSSLMERLDKLLKKRNEAMHPKERSPGDWDEEAAKHVLEECRNVIKMMVTDLIDRDNAKEIKA